MAEETTITTTVDEDYIARIQELKKNSVSKDEYERLRTDNKRLLDAMLNGAAQAESQTIPEPKEEVDIQALRNELYSGRYEGTDLDYITKTLKLRKAIMDQGGADPGVCNGVKTVAQDVDYENCEATANALQEIVDFANGDPAVFRAELMRRVKF